MAMTSAQKQARYIEKLKAEAFADGVAQAALRITELEQQLADSEAKRVEAEARCAEAERLLNEAITQRDTAIEERNAARREAEHRMPPVIRAEESPVDIPGLGASDDDFDRFLASVTR